MKIDRMGISALFYNGYTEIRIVKKPTGFEAEALHRNSVTLVAKSDSPAEALALLVHGRRKRMDWDIDE